MAKGAHARTMSRTKKLVAAGVTLLVVAGAVTSFVVFGGGGSASGTQTVIYSTVQTRTLQQTTPLTGTLTHKDITTVAAQSNGFVSGVKATDNATANPGDVLFALGGRNAIAEVGDIPFFRPLAPGDQGDDVLQLKQILAAAGDNPGTMDSRFTQQTQAALAQWQNQHGYPNANPANQEAVTASLAQGAGYNIGAQSSTGLIIGPPAGRTSATSQAHAASPPSANSHLSPVRTLRSPAPRALRPHAAPISVSISGGATISQGGSVTLTITSNVAPSQNTQIYLSLSGDAVAGVDYAPVNPVVVLGSGLVQATLTISALSNQTIQSSRFLDVAIATSPDGSYAAAEPATTTVTILQPSNQTVPTLTLTSSIDYLTKGSPYSVTIGLSEPVGTALTVTLSYGGSAVAGVDFTPPQGNIVVPAGQTTLPVTIGTVATNTVEPDRTLTVSLGTSSLYLVGTPASTSVTIHDTNVPQVAISGGTTIQPGNTATVTVSANQVVAQDTQVAMTVAGSAQAGTDYLPINPIVVIPSGQSSASVSITTLVNQTVLPDRYIVITLAQSPSGSYTVQLPGSTVVTLSGGENTAPPILTLTSAVDYLHIGSPFPVTVGMSEPIGVPITFTLSFSGTALQGTDFNAPAGELTIPAGQTSLQVSIPTVTSNRVQSDRTLTVSIAPGATYQNGAPSSATVTLTSTVVPTLTMSSSAGSVAEGSSATFLITADQAPSKDTSVNFTVTGSAQPGQDFVPLAGSVLLKAGQTQVSVDFQTIVKDVEFEPTDMIVGQWPTRIGQVFVKQGNAVKPGDPILSLTHPNVTVTLQASPSDFTKLALGQSCTMTIAGGQNQLSGTISELDSNPTLLSGSAPGQAQQQVFEGQIEVSDLSAGDQNADGATVSITVVTQQVTDALSVPVAAVKQNGTGADVVRVVDLRHGGKVTEVPVTTGLTQGAFIQVTGNLHVGQTVVVSVKSGS